MQIYVTRVDAHRYSTLVERDGVRLRVPGYGFMRALPHDLAHFVVEGSLGLNRGFWGSGADGAEFSGMESEGPRKPHASQKAKATAKENADYLSEAERLVACFERIVERDLDRVPQLADAELRGSGNCPTPTASDHRVEHNEGLCCVARDAGPME
jgi:hypothetical protein